MRAYFDQQTNDYTLPLFATKKNIYTSSYLI